MAYKFNPFTAKLEEYGPVLTGTGTVSAAADGTAALPGIAFTNNLSTGIYRPGLNQLAISTNGTGRLFVDANGKVGIGTSSPTSLLALLHTASTAYSQNTEGLTLRGSSGTVNRFTSLNFDGSGYAGNVANIAGVTTTLGTSYADSAGALRFATKNTTDATPVDRLTITAAGNVGIGTANPTQKVQITDGLLSNFYIAPGYGGGAGTTIGVGGGEYLAFNGAPFTTERMRIDSSGRLLVGTSTNTGGALFQVNDNRIRVATAKTPASATDTGSAGEICWDANYIYVCTATNTWKRSAIATW